MALLKLLTLNIAQIEQKIVGDLLGTVTEIDFGSTPVFEKNFTITDTNILSTDTVKAEIAYIQPTSKDLDEVEMDSFDLKCQAQNDSFILYVRSLEGRVYDKFKIRYFIYKS